MSDLKEMYQNVKSKSTLSNEKIQNGIGFVVLVAFCGWLLNRYVQKKTVLRLRNHIVNIIYNVFE